MAEVDESYAEVKKAEVETLEVISSKEVKLKESKEKKFKVPAPEVTPAESTNKIEETQVSMLLVMKMKLKQEPHKRKLNQSLTFN